MNLGISQYFMLRATNLHCYTHYANEIITESAIITSRARVNFKFSLGAVRLSIIELVRSTCSTNSCRKLRRSAASVNVSRYRCTACCIDRSDHRYSAKLWLFAIEIQISFWPCFLSFNTILRIVKLLINH